ncbi:hypothetical protein [Neglectibacter timonensis]
MNCKARISETIYGYWRIQELVEALRDQLRMVKKCLPEMVNEKEFTRAKENREITAEMAMNFISLGNKCLVANSLMSAAKPELKVNKIISDVVK